MLPTLISPGARAWQFWHSPPFSLRFSSTPRWMRSPAPSLASFSPAFQSPASFPDAGYWIEARASLTTSAASSCVSFAPPILLQMRCDRSCSSRLSRLGVGAVKLWLTIFSARSRVVAGSGEVAQPSAIAAGAPRTSHCHDLIGPLLALEPGHPDRSPVALVVEVGEQRDRDIGRIAQLRQPHLPEAVVEAPLHGAHDVMRAAIGGPGPGDLLRTVFSGHVHPILQADAPVAFAVALHASEVGLPAAAEEQVLARLVHLLFLRMVERDADLHPVRPRGDVERQRLHVGAVAARRADRAADDLVAVEALQLDHAGEQARFQVLDPAGIGEIARQPRAGALELARTQAEVALLERRVPGAALVVEQLLALLDPQLARVVLGEHLAADGDAGLGLRQRRGRRDEAGEHGERGDSAKRCGHESFLHVLAKPAAGFLPAGPRRGYDGVVGALVRLVVDPRDADPLACFRALHPQEQPRIAGNGLAPLGVHDGAAVVGDHHALDEMQRHDLALGILAIAGFHRVHHDDAHVGDVTLERCADSHRVGHDPPGYPQPPTVIFTSVRAT